MRRSKMLNKFWRRRITACEKMAKVACVVCDRHEMNEARLRALVCGKPPYSIGMETFRKALDACIVEDFTEVEA